MSASQSRPEAPLRLSVKDMVGKIYQLPAGIEVDSSLLGLVDFMKRFAHPLMAIGNDHAMTHYGAALLHAVLTMCKNCEVDGPPTIVGVRKNKDIVLRLPKKNGVQLTVPLNGKFIPLRALNASSRRGMNLLVRCSPFGYEVSPFTSPSEVKMTEYFVLTSRGNFYAVDEGRMMFESPSFVPFWTMVTRVIQILGLLPELPLLKGQRNMAQTPEDYVASVKKTVTGAMNAWSSSVDEVFVRFMPTEADVGTPLSEEFKAYLKSLYERSLAKAMSAALTVQRVWRRHRATVAAVKIQRFWRHGKAKAAAVKIQRFWRQSRVTATSVTFPK